MLLGLCQSWCCDHFPVPMTLWMRNFFLISSINLPWHNFMQAAQPLLFLCFEPRQVPFPRCLMGQLQKSWTMYLWLALKVGWICNTPCVNGIDMFQNLLDVTESGGRSQMKNGSENKFLMGAHGNAHANTHRAGTLTPFINWTKITRVVRTLGNMALKRILGTLACPALSKERSGHSFWCLYCSTTASWEWKV